MKKLLVLGVLIAFSLPALAGVKYTLRLETNDAGARTELNQDSWLQGEHAKLSFDDGMTSQHEIFAEHFGRVIYDADPASRHTRRISLESKPGSYTIQNIVTTKTHEEPGPVILGHPTKHLSFTSQFDYLQDGIAMQGTMTHELWIATDLNQFDVMSWIQFEYRLRRDQGVESLFRQVSTLGGGLPLAYDGVALIQNSDGNTHIIRLGAKVDSLENINVDPSVFSASSNVYEVVAGGK